MEFKLQKAKERNTKEETVLQKFIAWRDKQPKGRRFKRSDIKAECHLSDSQFKDLKRADILDSMRTDNLCVYVVT